MGQIRDLFRRSKQLALAAKFLGSAVTGALLAHTASAEALERRQHAVSCTQGSLDTPLVASSPQDGLGAGNLRTGTSVSLYCPLPEDSRFSKTQVNVLNLHGYHGNAHAITSARACVNYRSQQGGMCGQASEAIVQGDITLTPSLDVWSSDTANDFAYVWVTLPWDAGIRSSLRGYFVGD